jgi:sporulation and spore germination protein
MNGRAGGAVLIGVLVLGGCGVPTSSEVEIVGDGPVSEGQSPTGGVAPPTADEATTPLELVENFLTAAAGNPSTAVDRVREYLRASDQDGWHPEEPVRVVRELDEPIITDDTGGYRVELTVQQIGILRANGSLDAVSGGETPYTFRVVSEGGPDDQVAGQRSRLRIADPPSILLLSDTALTNRDYYFPTPIYFWDSEEHEQLVPDLRWLPQAGAPDEQFPWTVLRWLLEGPAPSLARLEGLPAGTQPVGTPVWQDDNRLVVNLNAAALGESGAAGVNDLATQLGWSMLQLRSAAQLELRIDDQPQEGATVREPAWHQAGSVRLAVLDGTIRQLSDGQPVSFPALAGDVNGSVLAGALTDQGRLAALVRQDEGSGERRLTVVEAVSGEEPTETPTVLSAGEIEQPTWLRGGSDPLGLVVAGGRLYRFTAGGSAQVTVPGVAGSVDAMAVAPERRRVALVADGELYVASLQLDGEAVTVDEVQAVPTTVENIAGVAFSHVDRLVVTGEQEGRVGLFALTVDGGLQDQLRNLGNASVTSLVAHPVEDSNALDVMYEANDQTYTYRGAPNLVRAQDLLNVTEETDAPPLAPFFVD